MMRLLLPLILIIPSFGIAKVSGDSFSKADSYNFKLIEKKINSFTRLNQMAKLFVPILPKKEQKIWQKRMSQWKAYKAPKMTLNKTVMTFQFDSVKVDVDFRDYRNGIATLNGIIFTYNKIQPFTQQVDFIANLIYRKSRSSAWLDSIVFDKAHAISPAIWAAIVGASAFSGTLIANEFGSEIINALKRETCDGLSENFDVPIDSVLSCPAESLIAQVRNSLRPQNITCNIEQLLNTSIAHSETFAKNVSFQASNTSQSAIEIFGPTVQVSGRTTSRYQSSFLIEFPEPRIVAKANDASERLPTDSLYITTNHNGEITECRESTTHQDCMSLINEYAEIRDWITAARTVLYSSFNDCRSRADAIEARLRSDQNPHRICDGVNCLPAEGEAPVSP